MVDRFPRRGVLALAAFVGVFFLLSYFSRRLSLNAHATFPGIALLIFGGPALGVAALYIVGFSVSVTGRVLGGSATPQDVRCAFAWSGVTTIPRIVLSGVDLTLQWGQFGHLPWGGNVLLTSALLGGVLGIWGLVIWWACVAEVHRFALWRAGLSLAMAGLAVGITAGLLFLIGVAFWWTLSPHVL